MGTWGAGNFDSDGAGDYVDEIIVQLWKRIDDILADEDRSFLDEEGESILMPSVELLYVICNHTKNSPPEEVIVQGWKEKYLNIYDDQIDDFVLYPESDFKIKRRQVIEDTFIELANLARKWDELRSKTRTR